MQFNSDKPTATALYLVDRGMQGKWYRWYNADKDQWGACGFDMNEAMEGKDNTATSEILGFFPWCGPLTGPNFKSGKDIELSDDEPKAKPAKRVAKRMAKKAPVAVVPKVKATKQPKESYPDGTVFFRSDRQKWVAVYGGKQEAARPTAEACLNFLKKKYNVVGNVLNKE